MTTINGEAARDKWTLESWLPKLENPFTAMSVEVTDGVVTISLVTEAMHRFKWILGREHD